MDAGDLRTAMTPTAGVAGKAMGKQEHPSIKSLSILATLVAHSLAIIICLSVGRDTSIHLTETPGAQAPPGVACTLVLRLRQGEAHPTSRHREHESESSIEQIDDQQTLLQQV